MNTKQGPADFIFYFLAQIVKCENCWGGKGTSIFLYAAISAPSASVRAWLWADVEDEKGGWGGRQNKVLTEMGKKVTTDCPATLRILHCYQKQDLRQLNSSSGPVGTLM